MSNRRKATVGPAWKRQRTTERTTERMTTRLAVPLLGWLPANGYPLDTVAEALGHDVHCLFHGCSGLVDEHESVLAYLRTVGVPSDIDLLTTRTDWIED